MTSSRVSELTPDELPGKRMLKAGTTVLWRGPDIVQLELGRVRMTVENVSSAALATLLPTPSRRSSRNPVGEDVVQGAAELTDRLDALGFLASWMPLASPGGLPARLSPDIAALSDAPQPDPIQRRRNLTVAIHGTSRVAVSVASTLAAAGLGAVRLVEGATVSAADACPAGLSPADEGRRFTAAAADAVRRYAPEADTASLGAGAVADLVVLTDSVPIDEVVRAHLHQQGRPHLVAFVDGRRSVVGPLVIPGVTSCLRCADLHRSDRDPAWPLLAIQLSNRPRHRAASDVALCVATSGLAALQALAFLDGTTPTTAGATIEWELPDWRLRRRSWPTHADCDCGATRAATIEGRMNL